MKAITTVNEMKEYSRKAREKAKSIGFVPTMGALHDGHMSLVKAARKECDTVIVSIFVNPTQFGPAEDFEKYPRRMKEDRKKAEDAGADCIFAPDADQMYPGGHATHVELDASLADVLCGKSRPGHFRGVATVVAKLFNIIRPDKSYFGQKDAQQAIIIEKMVEDLNMDTEIVVMPIIREEDGLAMSSRNGYLSEDERRQALGLYRSLKWAEEAVSSGERASGKVKGRMKEILSEGENIRIDYIEVLDARTLKPFGEIRDNTLIAVAAFVGKTRLIDNTVVRIRK
ncbi:MAG: pantoate--beta-alanine ligase [Candidatus Omnitrophota bacterium]